MDAIPLVEALTDSRNIISAVFYVILAFVASRILVKLAPRLRDIVHSSEIDKSLHEPECERKIGTIQVMTLALSLLILPFLPATNLFFYVGFVVAERVLYLPSLGFCLLVATAISKSSIAINKLVKKSTLSKTGSACARGALGAATLLLVSTFILRTLLRCQVGRILNLAPAYLLLFFYPWVHTFQLLINIHLICYKIMLCPLHYYLLCPAALCCFF